MATGGQSEGEVGGQIPDTVAGSEDLSMLKCQPCHEDGHTREAVGMCIDCQDYLCRKCYDSHTIPRPLRDHQLLDKQQMLQRKVRIQRKDKCTQKCSLHDEKVIEYYCKAHVQLGCNVCLNLDHRTCKPVQYIPQAATNLDSNTEFKETDILLNLVLKMCQTVSDIGHENVKSIETSCSEALEDVETYRSKINEALDEIQAEIVGKAENIKEVALDKINDITDKYHAAQRELQAFKTRTYQLHRRHQNCDLYTDMMKMKNRLKTFECEISKVEEDMRHTDMKISFTPNLEFLETLRRPGIFGNLTGDSAHGEQGAIVRAEYLQDINVQSSAVSGCTLLSDNTLVIVDANKTDIKEVSLTQNNIVSQMTLSSTPWDVCTIKPHLVAVTLMKEYKITFVNVDGSLCVDRSINVNGSCRGLDFKNDKLAVSYNSPEKVQVMTLQGQVLHDIKADQQGQTIFRKPFYLSFNRDGTSLYVSNHSYITNSVVQVKLDGTLLATYTDVELKNPLGAMVDRDGNVYVCGWSSHNIHQISPDCRKLRVLLEKADGINMPRSSCFNETENTFYVGFQSSTIKVYKAIR